MAKPGTTRFAKNAQFQSIRPAKIVQPPPMRKSFQQFKRLGLNLRSNRKTKHAVEMKYSTMAIAALWLFGVLSCPAQTLVNEDCASADGYTVKAVTTRNIPKNAEV